MSAVAPSPFVSTRPAIRIATIPVALALIVTVSAIARFAAIVHRSAPLYFPDEYLYSEISRSIASGGGVRILGAPAGMPALLEPIISALAWLPGDATLAFRLTQLLHAVAMSLAVIPIYLICRQLSLSSRWSLGVTIAASAYAGLLYSGFVTADSLGYLLCLVALYAAVRMLSAPRHLTQLAFLGAAGCATAARIQYAVIVPAVVLSALAVEGFRPLQFAKRFAVLGGSALVTAVALLAFAPSLAGRYGAVRTFRFSLDMVDWIGPTAFLLALAAGAAIVPGAIAWVAASVASRRDRAQYGFALLILTFVPLLVVATTVMNVGSGSDRFMERYLLVVMPLTTIAFAAWIRARTPLRPVAILVAGAIAVGAVLSPLSGYVMGQGPADSPLVLGFLWAGSRYGLAECSLVAALVVTAAAAAGAVASMRRGPSGAVVLGVTAVMLGVVSAGAHAMDISVSQKFNTRFDGQDPTWVDAAGAGSVTMIQTAGGNRLTAMAYGFWNASITRAVRLGAVADPIDGGHDRVHVMRTGAMLLGGERLSGPLLVTAEGTRSVFADLRSIGKVRGFDLLTPASSDPRLVTMVEGLSRDGWLGAPSAIRVYSRPGECRSATLTLSLPAGAPSVTAIVDEAGSGQKIRLVAGEPASLTFVSENGTPTFARITAARPIVIRNPFRGVTGRATLVVAPCVR